MENTVENSKDITTNWVTSSRFFFYVMIGCIVAMSLGGCYGLFTHRYKGKPKVTIPESTLYNPKYK
ncbi:hypothetical protein MKQ68_02755 [Chitinophaga horti]|uniref:Lipoprotein n=1 Tax=Chitinophaga horti TaxID=2920382 RepID=A0ABY6J5Z7_9BACT|nr:hypothetical protein [Chitinophaga horti]UYQ94012.1 hypothetical protein MKQ68_02755 [Chitinophaga horti]